MPNNTVTTITNAVRQVAHPLTGTASDYDPLMDSIEDARLVLIGEATHETHDFYEQRAEITQRLIQETGLSPSCVVATDGGLASTKTRPRSAIALASKGTD